MELSVWLAGACVATLVERRRRMTMTYSTDAGPPGVPLVSMSMPVSTGRFPDRVVRAFFHGLLPEGDVRRILAYDLGIDPSDDIGLLAALGGDCAGALLVQPAFGPVPVGSVLEDLLIDDAEVGRRLLDLPVHPLGVDQRIRVSLAGVQPKLLLCRRPDGRWLLPSLRYASTHILKPAHRDLPDSVANEAFCMNLAAAAGLPAAHTTTGTFAGFDVLVSERYDRRVQENGDVVRVHQEDACQALSVLTVIPERKYEEFGGPSLSEIAGQLDRWSGAAGKGALLGQVAFSCLVGNADMHGKNVSFLHDGKGTVALAPLYDVMSTAYYTAIGRQIDPTPGLFVNAKRHIDQVTLNDLVDEAEHWGMRPRNARSLLSELLERLPDAVDETARNLPKTPGALVDLVKDRVERMRSQRRTP